MKIYDGGSDKDSLLNGFTGNTLPSVSISNGNQIFISYTNNGDGAPGKGFYASITFGKKVTNFNFFNHPGNTHSMKKVPSMGKVVKEIWGQYFAHDHFCTNLCNKKIGV